MSHQSQLDFVASVKKQFPQYFFESKVLEVGSLDINGSIRQFFVGCDYVGVDLGEGRGVDVVARGEELDYPDDSFDVVASCECFEHNPEWVKTFNNMVLKAGVQDILNFRYRFFQDTDRNSSPFDSIDRPIFTFRRGTLFNVSFTYKLNNKN